MIIDRHARVAPPRSSHRAVSSAMGDLIGKADRDSQLRALLWIGQLRIAQRIEDGWRQHSSRLERELDEARKRRLFYGSWDSGARGLQRWECRQAADDLEGLIGPEVKEAQEALAECERARRDVRSALDDLAPLEHLLRRATERLDLLLARDRERLHLLAQREECFRRAREPGSTTRPAELGTLSGRDLAHLVRGLLEAEGWSVSAVQRAGAGAGVMQAADGRTLAVAYLDSARARTQPVLDVTAVRTARRAAAAALADGVLVVRNAAATLPARRYAREHGVTLADREVLERWAVWGCPLELSRTHDTDPEGP